MLRKQEKDRIYAQEKPLLPPMKKRQIQDSLQFCLNKTWALMTIGAEAVQSLVPRTGLSCGALHKARGLLDLNSSDKTNWHMVECSAFPRLSLCTSNKLSVTSKHDTDPKRRSNPRNWAPSFVKKIMSKFYYWRRSAIVSKQIDGTHTYVCVIPKATVQSNRSVLCCQEFEEWHI